MHAGALEQVEERPHDAAIVRESQVTAPFDRHPLVHVRAILGNLGVIVVPAQVSVPRAAAVFDEDGSLTDDATAGKVAAQAASLVQLLQKLRA